MRQDKPSSGAQAPAKVKHYGVRELFRKPDRSQFSISPDGRHLSFLARHQGRQNVFVQAIDTEGNVLGEARPLTHESERDLPFHTWKGNAHILYAKDFGGDENFHVLSVPIDGGEPVDLTPYRACARRSSTISRTMTAISCCRTTSATRKYSTCCASMSSRASPCRSRKTRAT